MFFNHGSFLHVLGRSVCGLGERIVNKDQSEINKFELDSDEDENSSSSEDSRLLRSSSSSPIFTTLFSIISPSTRYSRHMSIHDEYRSYFSTPTFVDKEAIDYLNQTKNKDIEQPSQPMLHPVLLEPRVLTKIEYNKQVKKNNDSNLQKDEDKSKFGKNILSCPICLCQVKTGNLIIQSKCGHVFHHKCIKPWFVEHHTCPICRAKIESA